MPHCSLSILCLVCCVFRSQAATSEKEFQAVAEQPAAAAVPGNPPKEGVLSKIFDNLPRFNGGTA